jgi:hypothetical protein
LASKKRKRNLDKLLIRIIRLEFKSNIGIVSKRQKNIY